MTYCDTCEFIGPREFEGDTLDGFVEVHRALHAMIREVGRQWVAVSEAFRSATDKSTKADYTLWPPVPHGSYSLTDRLVLSPKTAADIEADESDD